MINSNLDWDAIQKEYSTNGNVVIKDILNPDTANVIADSISTIDEWELYCSGSEGGIVMAEKDFTALPPTGKNRNSPDIDVCCAHWLCVPLLPA